MVDRSTVLYGAIRKEHSWDIRNLQPCDEKSEQNLGV